MGRQLSMFDMVVVGDCGAVVLLTRVHWVARITVPVPVGVRACIADVTGFVMVSIHLLRIRSIRAVVAHIADTVGIIVFLIGVVLSGTIIVGIENPVFITVC